MVVFILVISMIFRLLTFVVVMSYYKMSRLRTAWLWIAAAMVLLFFESFFQLLQQTNVSSLASSRYLPHLAGLAVSFLMLMGTMLINNILKRLDLVEQSKETISTHFELLFNTTSDQIFVLDTNGRIIEVNNAACERLESSREMLLSMHFADVKLGPQVEGVLDHMHIIRSKGRHIFETELKTQSGKQFPVEMNCRIIDMHGEPFVTCVARSISGRKELDKKVRIAIIETEETERKRFANEIHDGLGPLLSTIKLYVNELEAVRSEEEKEDLINFTNNLIDEAVDSARNIANNITPKILADYGLKTAILNFSETINATNLLKVEVRCEHIDRSIGPTLELIFFRIITELINNTIKHANASSIDIVMRLENNMLYLDYTDDGIGFDLQQAIDKGDDHMGVKNIINRVRSMNGTFNFYNTYPGIRIQIAVAAQPKEV